MDNLGFGKVLLVEDDERLAALIAHFLEQHGYEVRTVLRGDLAVAAFLEFKPKIVVLDLMLPGQSGLQVCREIRSVSDTPIVILTAKEDDLDHSSAWIRRRRLRDQADQTAGAVGPLAALQRRQVPDSSVVSF